MKFTRTSGKDGVDTYGRWISDCGRFSVQRFQYKKAAGMKDHTKVKPYYNVYDLYCSSCGFDTHLKNWKAVIAACEERKTQKPIW